MNKLVFVLTRRAWLMVVAILSVCSIARASTLDPIGVTLLQTLTTNLNGSGIRVAQPEGDYDQGTNWEVNPYVVGQPVALFTYTSGAGSTNYFPNDLSSESAHADSVSGIFYGFPNGVATNVAQVDNYAANYFYSNFIDAFPFQPAMNSLVVNQSFSFGNASTNVPTPTNYLSVSDQQQVDSAYDNYAAKYNTFFASAVNNGGSVSPPGTSYNSIGVGAYGGNSSIGPTVDNGRAKPDITAPSSETSFSTPQVAGAAAILIQAGLRGDGGSDTNAAADIRTVKALLMNGAVKPADWVNISPSPLDARYGAGVLNVFNSYEQLVGGKQGYIISASVSSGNPHPPTGAIGTIGVLSGWDFNTNSSGVSTDGVKHYYFNITNGTANAIFTATATLVWNRQQNKTTINNLGLFLYNAANSNLVASSTSLVDNVEHVFVPKLASGRYDLQVWKAAGVPGFGIVSSAEPYALAFAFTAPVIAVAGSETNVLLSWPAYPAGFCVEATTDLTASAWSTSNLPPAAFTNNMNNLWLNATNAAQFFRLRQPNF